ncbi:MAG: methylmalonyl-CoA mutase family protein [Bacteroidales bacterium]|nr:methylmalonyl-CoA mutase family protein [Bacteroidales bacterium]
MEKIANKIAKNAIEKGADSVMFIAHKPFDFKKLFQEIDLVNKHLVLKIHFLDEAFLIQLIQFVKDKNVDLFIDIIGNLVRSGNWFFSEEKDVEIIKKLLHESENKLNIIGVDAAIYQNSGANNVQQISYALSHFMAYLDKNIQPKKILFNFAIGSNYFFEIAKIRAFRYLFTLISREMDLDIALKISTIPSKRNKTIYDYNVNLLRTTTEQMSALLAGSEYVCTLPYDAIYHKSNDFGERIARNQLLILKQESYFKDAYKLADGAYYIENITLQLVEKALVLLKDIDKNNGFLAQLKKGTIQRKIEESASKEQKQFDAGNLVLLGTNKYPNEKDKMKTDLELFPFVKYQPRKTVIKPIIEKRLSEQIEKQRLENES